MIKNRPRPFLTLKFLKKLEILLYIWYAFYCQTINLINAVFFVQIFTVLLSGIAIPVFCD